MVLVLYSSVIFTSFPVRSPPLFQVPNDIRHTLSDYELITGTPNNFRKDKGERYERNELISFKFYRIFNRYNLIFTLVEVVRQLRRAQSSLRDFLMSLRECKVLDSDYETIKARMMRKIPTNCVALFSKNFDVENHNFSV